MQNVLTVFGRIGLYLTVFLTGASVMVIELLGTRMTSTSLLPDQADWLKSRVFAVSRNQGELLTDNLNPLEHLQIRKSEHYRHFLVDWLGADLLVR